VVLPVSTTSSEQEEIMTAEFWLHLHDDGREERYDHDPAPIQALHVVVTDGVEETWTSDRVVRPGWGVSTPPPGKGWAAAGGSSGSTLWRRKHITPEEFWLHVRDDGREERYDHDPAPIRALHVVVTGGFEETWTSDRGVRPGWGEPILPPGKGWAATGGSSGSTLWRRKRPGT
jgi:hypothetical protein